MKAILETIGGKLGGMFEPMADDMTSVKHHVKQIERRREVCPLEGVVSPARPAAFVSPLELPADREVLYVGLGDKLAVVEIERPIGHGTDVPLPADAFDVRLISL